MGSKACPACSQANSLAQLSCSLCGAKFSVAHTSRLLQLWRQGDDSHALGGGTRYAELESTVDTAVQPELQSSDVTSESFKLLPLDAQIQARYVYICISRRGPPRYMREICICLLRGTQEKAAQRLRTRTLPLTPTLTR